MAPQESSFLVPLLLDKQKRQMIMSSLSPLRPITPTGMFIQDRKLPSIHLYVLVGG